MLAFGECPSSLPALGQMLFAGLPGLTGRLAALVVVCQLVARSASAAPTAVFLQTVVHTAAVVHLAVVVLPLCATKGVQTARGGPTSSRSHLSPPHCLVEVPSPSWQNLPSQPLSQKQLKLPRLSMHVPCPQHGLLHLWSKGGASHWSPSVKDRGMGQ